MSWRAVTPPRFWPWLTEKVDLIMDTTLLFWRDLSVVWLVLLAMLFALIPGAALFFALKYLRKFNRWLRTPLLTAQVWGLRIQYGTTRATQKIANVPISMRAGTARLSTTARGVIDYLRNG